MAENIIPPELEEEITGKIHPVSIPHGELALAQALSDNWFDFSRALGAVQDNAGIVPPSFKDYGSMIALYENILDELGLEFNNGSSEDVKNAVLAYLQKKFGVVAEG